MINPIEFREACENVFGSMNCVFKNLRYNNWTYQEIECYVHDKKLAALLIDDDLSTMAKVYFSDNCKDSLMTKYLFMFKHLLSKRKKKINDEHDKLFNIYRKIYIDIGETQNAVTKTIQYLVDAEYCTAYDKANVLQSVIDHICMDNPGDGAATCNMIMNHLTSKKIRDILQEGKTDD